MEAREILVKDLRYSYGGRIEALKGISFEVLSGEVFGILGPNGAGKTTLLKCIVGILSPDAGEIYVEGKEISKISSRDLAKMIAYVPQTQYYTFPFKVLDFVEIGRAPYCGMLSVPGEKDLEIVERSLEELGIKHLQERPISELSGGELRMAMIARALAQEPKILALDEPASHLDVSNKLKVLGMIRSLVDSSKVRCSVLTLHDPFLCAMFCDRVLLMKEGSQFSLGPTLQVLKPENLRKVYGICFKEVEVDGKKVPLPFFERAERPYV